MTRTRRETLLLTVCAVTPGLSGCQLPLLSGQPRIDLHLVNYTSSPQNVKIEVLRTDESEYDEAEVFSGQFEVPEPELGEPAGSLTETGIVEQRPYILYVQPKYAEREYHHHYYPDTDSPDDENAQFDVRLYRRANSDIVYPKFFM